MKNDPVARAREIAKRIAPKGTYAEIGVWQGHTARRVLTMRPDVSAILVDPWAPAPEGSSYAASGSSDSRLDAKGFDRIFRSAQKSVRPFGKRVKILRMTSAEAVRGKLGDALSRQSISVVFIDADHSYAGCASDIALWRDLAIDWLGGHDYAKESFPGVTKAVDELCPGRELGADSTWWLAMHDNAPICGIEDR